MSERKEEDLKEEVNSSEKESEITKDTKISVSNINDLVNLLAKSDCKVSKYDGNFNAFKIDFPSDKDGTNLFFHLDDSEDAESYLSLTEDLEKAKKALDEKFYRLAAEFENYKKEVFLIEINRYHMLKKISSKTCFTFLTILKEVWNYIKSLQKKLIFIKE